MLSRAHIRPDVIEWAQRFAPTTRRQRSIPLDFIVAHTAAAHDLGVEEMLAKRRSAHLAHARQLAMYLCRKRGNASFRAIADVCRRDDHTTAVYAEKQVVARLESDSEYASWVNDLADAIDRSYEEFRTSKYSCEKTPTPFGSARANGRGENALSGVRRRQ
jgi:Tfp pilus assembly protein PilN